MVVPGLRSIGGGGLLLGYPQVGVLPQRSQPELSPATQSPSPLGSLGVDSGWEDT